MQISKLGFLSIKYFAFFRSLNLRKLSSWKFAKKFLQKSKEAEKVDKLNSLNVYKSEIICRLTLEELGITSFPVGLPISLTYLKLSRNNLSEISDEVLRLKNLKVLILDNNEITHFRFETFIQMTNLEFLYILNNPVVSRYCV